MICRIKSIISPFKWNETGGKDLLLMKTQQNTSRDKEKFSLTWMFSNLLVFLVLGEMELYGKIEQWKGVGRGESRTSWFEYKIQFSSYNLQEMVNWTSLPQI
jgi:hypothetical protein